MIDWSRLARQVLGGALLSLGLGGVVLAADASGPSWASLSAQQRIALAPLAGDWASIDGPRRQKWLEVAARFDQLSPAERERVQQRMAEWARLTPAERSQARLNYQGAKQLSVEERQARWEAYQALPEDQRRKLGAKGQPAPPPKPSPAAAAQGRAATGAKPAVSTTRPPVASAEQRRPTPPGEARPKVNTVPSPREAAKLQPVSPTVVQAKPGASTRLITQQPAPQALHQQPGMPKIAATSEFVDRKTLLPQRGPQSAGAEPRAAAASGPAKR
jgi:Protein of unknown function (DUF3106)